MALSRKRPSRVTAYCGLLPMTLPPVASQVWNSATGVATDGSAEPGEKETAIIFPSGAM